MFQEFVEKNVRVFVNDYTNTSYSMDGKMISSTESVTTLELEGKKKVKFKRAINNNYIIHIDEIK